MFKPVKPEKEPKKAEAERKGQRVPPGNPDLAEAPLEEPYGKASGSEPQRTHGEEVTRQPGKGEEARPEPERRKERSHRP
ncbi:hypothetical protein SH611_14725 [Geminicoccaceae bacterium 1502E]|nr:hypothetical protein [Geminicoccaceae bacterium 1502E]